MSTVAEIALAVQDVVDSGDYSTNDLELEMALLDLGIGDIPQTLYGNDKLKVYREMAGNDWLRVVTLLVYWNLDGLMSGGYFKDVG